MRKITLFLLSLLFLGAQALQAQRQVTGKVTSADDGKGIPGVTVLVKGTQTGTTTDIDGKYRLNVSDKATTLVFSFIGMKTKEVAIAGKTTLDVVMESDQVNIEGVVVTAPRY